MNELTQLLIKKKLSISTIESCTSGLLASQITDTEGSSAVFKGGVITYSNDTKINFGIPKSVIEEYGVYSSQCAVQMALVCQKYFNTDIAISVTGTAGNPDPNNSDSVIGKAWYCIRIFDRCEVFEINENVLDLTRHQIKKLYTRIILQKVFELISDFSQVS